MNPANVAVRNTLSLSSPIDFLVSAENDKSIDEQFLHALSIIRENEDSGIRYSFEELLGEDGLSLADIDSMEDVEIE